MDLTETQRLLEHSAEAVGPAVIGLGRGWGRGSGVVVAEGVALAALHGPGGCPGQHRRGPDEGGPLQATFADGRTVPVELAGHDPATGLAVLALDTSGITPVPAGPGTQSLAIGAPVVALGNPGGRGLRVTHGFVASAPRSMDGPRGRRIEAGIEHTAPLPRGSSGGPLVDAEGRLVGVNVLRPGPGLILAIATGPDVAERAVAVARGEVTRPRTLGVALAPPHVARRMRRAVGLPEAEGVLVREVAEGSPAEAAGLASGDLITTAGGAPVTDVGALARAIDAAPADGTLLLGVLRGTEAREVTVALTTEPAA